MKTNQISLLVLVGLAFFVSGCQRTIGLVPTPVAYQDERTRALWDPEEAALDTTVEIFYATDRKPVGDPDNIRYPNTKAGPVMLGTAKMHFGDKDMTWKRMLKLSFSDTRNEFTPIN